MKALRTGVALGLALLLLSGTAQAGMGDSFRAIGGFEDAMVTAIVNAVSDPGSDIRRAADQLFFTMALALFIWKAAGWALRGFVVHDVFLTLAQIATIAGIMSIYPVLVPAIFGATRFIGDALMGGIMGVDVAGRGSAALPMALTEMLGKYTFKPDCGPASTLPGGCLLFSPGGVLGAILSSVAIALLGIMALIVDVWGFWGFAIAMATGILLVPFALYERLAFMMDGWLRFFIGFMVYLLVARANLGLVAFSFMTFLGSTPAALFGAATPKGSAMPVTDFVDVIGMLLFVGVGLFALASTSSFARGIVAGAGGKGVNFGGVVRGAVGTIAGTAAFAAVAVSAASAAAKGAKASGKNVAQATLAGAKAAFKASGSKAVNDLKRNNSAFAKGFTVGREGAAGAKAGAARGLKFNADPSKPTGGGVTPTGRQRARSAAGAVIGGTGAVVSTMAKQAFGLKVEDSGRRAAQLDEEKNRGVQDQVRASDFIDKYSEKGELTSAETKKLETSLRKLTSALNNGTREQVRAAREELADAKVEVDVARRERNDIRATDGNATRTGYQAAAYLDTDKNPQSKELTADERTRVDSALDDLYSVLNGPEERAGPGSAKPTKEGAGNAMKDRDARDAVNEKTEALRTALNEVEGARRERSDIAQTQQRAVSSGVQAFQYIDRMGSKLSTQERERIASAGNELDAALGGPPRAGPYPAGAKPEQTGRDNRLADADVRETVKEKTQALRDAVSEAKAGVDKRADIAKTNRNATGAMVDAYNALSAKRVEKLTPDERARIASADAALDAAYFGPGKAASPAPDGKLAAIDLSRLDDPATRDEVKARTQDLRDTVDAVKAEVNERARNVKDGERMNDPPPASPDSAASPRDDIIDRSASTDPQAKTDAVDDVLPTRRFDPRAESRSSGTGVGSEDAADTGPNSTDKQAWKTVDVRAEQGTLNEDEIEADQRAREARRAKRAPKR